MLSYAVGKKLQEQALSLSLKCLSFDFVGTSLDESSEEFGTVQVYKLPIIRKLECCTLSFILGLLL